MSLLSKHKEVESELAAARERLQQQATDLVLKASMYVSNLIWKQTSSFYSSLFFFCQPQCRFRVPKDCLMLYIEFSNEFWVF